MRQYTLQINGQAATTNDAGVFVLPINKNMNHVKASLQNASYTILYPNGGFVLVPRDINEITEIVIGNPTENEFLSQYLKIYKQLKNNSSSTSAEITKLAHRLDSLQKMLLQLHYTETDLIKAQEIQDGKDKNYPEITQNLIEFKNRAFDLASSLKYISDYAFDNAAALQKLYEAVTNYNNTRNLLDRQRLNYEKYIKNYWQDEALTNQYRQLASFALDTLHTNSILPLRDEIDLINQYFQKKKDNQLKKTIQNNINTAMPKLDSQLIILDRKTAAFLQQFSE